MTSTVDLAYYVVSRAKDWESVDCGTNCKKFKYWDIVILPSMEQICLKGADGMANSMIKLLFRESLIWDLRC